VAGLNDFVREAVEFYPHLRPEMVRIVLVHPGDVILPELDPRLGAYAQRKLAERGVEIRLGSRVTAATDREVVLGDGTAIVTNTLVWAAGTAPCPLLADLPCAKERGRLCVDANLELDGWPGVWAVGDCAYIREPATGRAHPPTGQHALREGKAVARNIAAAVRGRAKRPFRFSALGQLAAIGRRTGVAQILGVNFSGFFAWWLWRTIYLSKLPRFEKKTRVALDWTLDLLFTKDLVQFDTRRSLRPRAAARMGESNGTTRAAAAGPPASTSAPEAAHAAGGSASALVPEAVHAV
jgi:NADH dehydrogenase